MSTKFYSPERNSNTRTCIRTNKEYSDKNIPMNRYESVEVIRWDGNIMAKFKIFAENYDHPRRAWYEEPLTHRCIFLQERYAVFRWYDVSLEFGFYRQASNWYSQYSRALKSMIDLATQEDKYC